MARQPKPFKIAPGGAFAYRPGELIVPIRERGRATRALDRIARGRAYQRAPIDHPDRGERKKEPVFDRVTGLRRTLETQRRLQEAGVDAQVNHVLFATGSGCCCSCEGPACPPHPSTPGADAYNAAHELQSNPFWANPFWANPFWANPFWANEAGHRCHSGGTTANPFWANPFWANPFWANPFWANAESNPVASAGTAQSEPRRSSAVPATVPDPNRLEGQPQANGVRVAILDSGYAHVDNRPAAEFLLTGGSDDQDKPDVEPEGNPDGYLDPIAGHGTFIAGVIEQRARGCRHRFVDVLSTRGDCDEADLVTAIDALHEEAQLPHLMNISIAGYSPFGMPALTRAIKDIQDKGVVVVASAGNDATCIPTWPAAIPGVIGVGALVDGPDETGYAEAAPFTNYGPWVSASAPGVEIISSFFNFVGATLTFNEWAIWSGTSFAAPRVVGALAAKAKELRVANPGTEWKDAVSQAVEALIDNPAHRKPMLGAIVT